jgi:hypothetical protein
MFKPSALYGGNAKSPIIPSKPKDGGKWKDRQLTVEHCQLIHVDRVAVQRASPELIADNSCVARASW